MIPDTVFLTDDAGTVTLTHEVGTSLWVGCYLLVVPNGLDICACQVSRGSPTSGTVLISYVVEFGTAGAGCAIQITRNWASCTDAGNCAYCTGTANLTTCDYDPVTCTPPASSGECSDNVSDVYGPVTETNCATLFPLSATLTLGFVFCGGGSLSSPLGPDVTINT
jgi:hypothetical protein